MTDASIDLLITNPKYNSQKGTRVPIWMYHLPWLKRSNEEADGRRSK